MCRIEDRTFYCGRLAEIRAADLPADVIADVEQYLHDRLTTCRRPVNAAKEPKPELVREPVKIPRYGLKYGPEWAEHFAVSMDPPGDNPTARLMAAQAAVRAMFDIELQYEEEASCAV